jgi:hypothetical protein
MIRVRIGTNFILMATSIFVLCFVSCKKGNDDPLISLRSRIARITSDWEVYASTAEWRNGIYSGSWTVINNKMIVTYTNFPVDFYDYYFNFSIRKNYTYSIEQVYLHNDTMLNSSRYIEGRWNFLNKSDGYKNKERIVLFPLKIISKNSNKITETLLLFQNGGEIMEIDELRSKQLIITSNYKKNDTVLTKIEMTLKCKK